MPRVQDIMTRNPMTCRETDVVFKAVEIMKRQNIGVVPIVDQNQIAKGIITDRDIVLDVIYDRKDPQSTQLRDVMTHGLVTCRADEDVNAVIQNMRNHKVKRVLVVDNQGHCIGIVSESDVAQKLGETGKVAEMSKGIYGGAR